MARAFDLRPLQFGDHLSRSFSMFVQHWLSLARWFLLMWLVPMLGVTLLLHTLLDPYAHLHARSAIEPETFEFNRTTIYHWLTAIISIALAHWFAAGGVMYMGARYYVGASPGFVETARAVFRRGGALTSVVLVHLLAISGIALLCIGPAILIGQGRGSDAEVMAWLYVVFMGTPALFLVLFVYMGRYGLGPACVILDDADGASALPRSQVLAKGFRWRLYMLMFVAAMLTGIPGLFSVLDIAGSVGRGLLVEAGQPLAGDLLRQLWQGIFGPLFFLPMVVFYFDQRSRKEGYDIAVMAQNFGIDEVELLRHQHGTQLGYTPKGWKGGRLHPKPQPAQFAAPAQPWPQQQWAQPQWAQPPVQPSPPAPRPRAVTYRPPVPRKELK